MPDDKPLTTEEALKALIKETDRAVAKAQGGNGDGGRESQTGAEGDSGGWRDDGGRSRFFIRS